MRIDCNRHLFRTRPSLEVPRGERIGTPALQPIDVYGIRKERGGPVTGIVSERRRAASEVFSGPIIIGLHILFGDRPSIARATRAGGEIDAVKRQAATAPQRGRPANALRRGQCEGRMGRGVHDVGRGGRDAVTAAPP